MTATLENLYQGEFAIDGIVPALITPFNYDKERSINYDAYGPIMDSLISAGSAAFFVNGSTAEVTTLTIEERMLSFERMMDVMRSQKEERRIPIIVHVGATSVENAVTLAKHAAEHGAYAVSSIPPNHLDRQNSTPRGDAQYYKEIGEATDLPVVAYLRSDMQKGRLNSHTYMEGTEEEDGMDGMDIVPNLAAIKFVHSDYHAMQTMLRLGKGRLSVYNGPDETLIAGLAFGARGAIGSTYNALPETNVAIYKGYKFGGRAEREHAEKLQYQTDELIDRLVEFNAVTPGTKAIMNARGLPAGPCRKGSDFSAHTQNKVRHSIKKWEEAEIMEIVDKYDLK